MWRLAQKTSLIFRGFDKKERVVEAWRNVSSRFVRSIVRLSAFSASILRDHLGSQRVPAWWRSICLPVALDRKVTTQIFRIFFFFFFLRKQFLLLIPRTSSIDVSLSSLQIYDCLSRLFTVLEHLHFAKRSNQTWFS